MKQYRIKTEAEFENEFGTAWRRIVQYRWVDKMNCLFDKQLSDKQVKDLESKGLYMGCWHISKDMVTEINCQSDKRAEAKRHFDGTYFKRIKVEVSGRITTVELDGKTATATCHPNDNFNYTLGLSVALARLARELGEYETEVEETVVVKKKKKLNILDETKI